MGWLMLVSCGEAGNLLDLALNPPQRKPIDKSLVGVNNFFVDTEFGKVTQQYADIHDTLHLKYVRVLCAWTTDVQSSPAVSPTYGFFDSILANIPAGVDVLVVLSHTPDWMTNSGNWISGDPRLTWVEKWVRPTVARYAAVPGIVGFEIWNEEDTVTVPSDAALALTQPENYMEVLKLSSQVIRTTAQGKMVVSGATQSIQQNFPAHLNYNKKLRDLGAEGYIDAWAVHYYGKSFESVITSNGVADFLNSVVVPVWITESGENGPTDQLAYVETAWPFLKEKVPSIARIYYYQYGDTSPAAENYGLRTTDPQFPVSDLYVWLRDN